MKRNIWILGIYPTVAAILLLSTVFLFSDWWRISFTGEQTEGRIKASFYLREDGSNALLSGLDTELRMTRGNGDQLVLNYEDHVIVSAADAGRPLEIEEDGIIRFSEDFEADKKLTAEFRDVLTGRNDRADWFLLRQKRVGTPESFVRLEKKETALIWEGLPADFNNFVFDEAADRVVPVENGDNFEVSRLVTTAIFSYEDEAAYLERRREMLLSFERTRDGELLSEEDSNGQFVIFNEPYWTARYPVFVFEADGQTLAIKADIGRHGDASLAFPLFAEVWVNYLPGTPEQALMNGKITARKPGEQFLNWFSRASEVFLTRWIYPGMFLLCAAIMAVVSVLFISMVVFPVKKLPPVPEDKEKESEGEDAEEPAKA